MHLVYIAGAYSADQVYKVKQNIDRAEALGMEIVKCFGGIGEGVMVIIPHCNTKFWEGVQSGKWFYDATMELLKRCDAMIYVPGDEERSQGTKDEILHCQTTNKPYFRGDATGLAEFDTWLAKTDAPE